MFEARIAHFEEAIQEGLRAELERLLGIALVMHAPPAEDVTHDEMVGWLLARGWCLHRGGNNTLDFPDGLRDAVREENEAYIECTQGSQRPHDEIHEAARQSVTLVLLGADEHAAEQWRAALLAERVRQHIIVVHAEIQRPFNDAVTLLRAGLAGETD